MLRKECRECLPWCVGATALLLFFSYPTLMQGGSSFMVTNWSWGGSWGYLGPSALSGLAEMLWPTALALAVALALRQFRVPGFTHEWAFLLHRSASRYAILGTKLAVGVGGLVAGLGGFWTLCYLRLSWPGQPWVPPPVWHYWEGWGLIAWAATVYLGAALTCLSPWRWYGTFSFGAILPVVGFCVAFTGNRSPLFSLVLAGICVALLIPQLVATFVRREF